MAAAAAPSNVYFNSVRVSRRCGFAMQLITTLQSMEARRWRKYYTSVPWNANQPNLWVRQLQRPTYTSIQRVSWCCGFAMQLLLLGDGRTGRSGDGEGEERDGWEKARGTERVLPGMLPGVGRFCYTFFIEKQA